MSYETLKLFSIGCEQQQSTDQRVQDLGCSLEWMQPMDPNLRVKKICKIMNTRNDLTVQQRRRLQSRKNTISCRERQKTASDHKHLMDFELDAIQNAVSTRPSSSGSPAWCLPRPTTEQGSANCTFSLSFFS